MRKRLYLKAIIITFTAIAMALVLFIAGLYLTSARQENLPPLQNGDIIFRSGIREQAIAIFLATASPYTHMGLIKIEEGAPFVIEAVGPVKKTPLQNWINGGVGGRVTIKRVRNLAPDQANAAIQAAEKLYGRPYDAFFKPGKDALYCSELVHTAFQSGPGIALGQMQKFETLNTHNIAVQNLLRQRWKRHPECRKQKIKDFSQCLAIIYQQELITPASIANDTRLTLVYSNYGFEK